MSQSLEGGIRVETLSVVERTGYPLALAVLPGEQILLRFYHDGARVAAETVDWLAALLETVLRRMVADPAAEPLRLPLADATPAAAAPAIFPVACLHHLFETVAARVPDAVAVALVDDAGHRAGAP
ncbi:hypothetical protein ACFQU7_37740 [Pseudoroseomonas wenyumeiae]